MASKLMPSTSSAGNPDPNLRLSSPTLSSSSSALLSVRPSPSAMISNSISNYPSSSCGSPSSTATNLHHESKAGELSSSTTTTPTPSNAGLFAHNYVGGAAGNAEITLTDSGGATYADNHLWRHQDVVTSVSRKNSYSGGSRKTADDVWREIVGGSLLEKECKVETPDVMMTLEDFLAKAEAVEEEGVVGRVEDVRGLGPSLATQTVEGSAGVFDPINQAPLFSQSSLPRQQQMAEGTLLEFGIPRNNSNPVGEMIGAGVGGRGKKGGPILEPLDKNAQQRQRRMIKNRESAARSRERKQAYQVELEALACRLEEENEQLQLEKLQRTKERYKQLMENVVPVVERRRSHRYLRRIRSMQW